MSCAQAASCCFDTLHLFTGTLYTFTLAARNDIGDSSWSSTSEQMKAVSTPPEKMAPLVWMSSGPTFIQVSWTAPWSNGEALEMYEINWRNNQSLLLGEETNAGTYQSFDTKSSKASMAPPLHTTLRCSCILIFFASCTPRQLAPLLLPCEWWWCLRQSLL